MHGGQQGPHAGQDASAQRDLSEMVADHGGLTGEPRPTQRGEHGHNDQSRVLLVPTGSSTARTQGQVGPAAGLEDGPQRYQVLSLPPAKLQEGNCDWEGPWDGSCSRTTGVCTGGGQRGPGAGEGVQPRRRSCRWLPEDCRWLRGHLSHVGGLHGHQFLTREGGRHHLAEGRGPARLPAPGGEWGTAGPCRGLPGVFLSPRLPCTPLGAQPGEQAARAELPCALCGQAGARVPRWAAPLRPREPEGSHGSCSDQSWDPQGFQQQKVPATNADPHGHFSSEPQALQTPRPLTQQAGRKGGQTAQRDGGATTKRSEFPGTEVGSAQRTGACGAESWRARVSG